MLSKLEEERTQPYYRHICWSTVYVVLNHCNQEEHFLAIFLARLHIPAEGGTLFGPKTDHLSLHSGFHQNPYWNIFVFEQFLTFGME